MDDESLQIRHLLTSFEREALDEALIGVDPLMTNAAVYIWEAARLYYTATWLEDAWRALMRAEDEFEQKKLVV